LVIALYMVTEEDSLRKIVNSVIPARHVGYIVSLLSRIRDKLTFWIRAQLILSVIIGITTFIVLSLLGVRYAAALALIAALLEFVPFLGPIIAAVPAFIIAFTQGGVVLFLVVLAFYVVLQQAENHILVPKIMQKAVGLNPVVSIVALLIGAQLAGILGAILAIPVAIALSVIIKDVIEHKITT
jgi:predicted PurR-regulated permease PerM